MLRHKYGLSKNVVKLQKQNTKKKKNNFTTYQHNTLYFWTITQQRRKAKCVFKDLPRLEDHPRHVLPYKLDISTDELHSQFYHLRLSNCDSDRHKKTNKTMLLRLFCNLCKLLLIFDRRDIDIIYIK